MANYLPVLLVSASSGIPDDASFQPLPTGQVDYLSHDWQEEDVWRSWRNMTKQKNEIANGVRLENASWRTWWKQRNNLKTISPETLNWLKDSDVTWLYGPLHTAVEWTPPPKPEPVVNTLSSPSSTAALDLSGAPNPKGRPLLDPIAVKKPILKHRTISEMLTSALPAGVMYDFDTHDNDNEHDDDPLAPAADASSASGSSCAGSPRPSLLRIRSDTNITQRSARTPGACRKRSPPPRVSKEPLAVDTEHALQTHPLSHPYLPPRIGTPTLQPRVPMAQGARSGSSDTTSSRSDAEAPAAPPKKHITFNTFVEQCIAIEKPKSRSSSYISGSRRATSWRGPAFDGDAFNYDADDGYDEDREDGRFEDMQSQSDSDGEIEEDEDEDDVLEIRTRRSSISSQRKANAFRNFAKTPDPEILTPRPTLRLPSLNRSNVSQTSDKEHVTIAPIAPTILKTGGSSGTVMGGLYRTAANQYGYGSAYAFPGRGGRVGDDDDGGVGGSGELVYQPPEGSIYCVRAESVAPYNILSPPMVSSPSCDSGAEEDGFDYFQGPDLGEDFTLRSHHHLGLERWKSRAERDEEEAAAARGTLRVVNGALVRERAPSPDDLPLINPRVVSIKSESMGRGVYDATPTASGLTTPTLAIPTPGISPAHQHTPSPPMSADDTSHAQSTFLSPTDCSPSRDALNGTAAQGSSPPSSCASLGAAGYVTSGSATSSAFSSTESGSRSVSEGRSESQQSRGRSRTPGSPSDAERGERERGRSRSRSSGGTGSPLGSVSPNSSRPGSVIGGGGYRSTGGYAHSGREIRDGRGVRLYRKTSEDFIPRPERGRERERDRRVSESLSPPEGGRGAALGPPARGRQGPNGAGATSMYHAYAVNSFGKAKEDGALPSPSPPAPASSTLTNGRLATPSLVINDQAWNDSAPSDGSSADLVPGTTLGLAVCGSAAPSSNISVIMEEDEQRHGIPTPANSPVRVVRATVFPEPATKATVLPPPAPSIPTPAPSLPTPKPTPTRPVVMRSASSSASSATIRQSEPEEAPSSTIAGRAADIVSSARGLLGAIWGGN